jgi:VanZ family protein
VSPVAIRSLAPLALMAAIFYLSAQPSVGPELPAFTRVIAHFSEYALLAALWAWALAPSLGRRAIAVAAAICVAFALSDEFHQSFVEGRDSDPLDVLADCLGIAFAVYLVSRLSARRAAAGRRPTSP